MGVVVVGALLILLIGSMIFKIFMFNVRLGELENRLGLTKSQKSLSPPCRWPFPASTRAAGWR